MIIAVGGTGVGWFAFALAASVFYAVSQLLVVLDKHEARWPLWKASTKPGEIALLVFSCGFIVFCLVGLILAL